MKTCSTCGVELPTPRHEFGPVNGPVYCFAYWSELVYPTPDTPPPTPAQARAAAFLHNARWRELHAENGTDCGDNDLGASSNAIRIVVGSPDDQTDMELLTPFDVDDFGRCHRLIVRRPECRAGVDRLAEIRDRWRPFATVWSQIDAAYVRGLETGDFEPCYALVRACNA